MPNLIKTARPQIHGHRGCRGLLPENTLPAFLHALQLGVDVLEMDVVLSADQQVVVAHEPWLSAKLGLSPDGKPIDPQGEQLLNLFKMPYTTVQQSVIGTLPHPGFPSQQQIATYRPLLSEVLQATELFCQQTGRPPVGYSIEIKSSPETEGEFHPAPHEFTTTVLADIPTTLIPRVTLLSFDSRILQTARQLLPRLRLCLLLEIPFSPNDVFSSLGFIPEVLGPDYKLLDAHILSRMHQLYNSLEVVPWTANEPPEIIQLANMGVTGITTDYPDVALQVLQ